VLIAHRRTPANRAATARYPTGSAFVPPAGVEGALVVAKEPKGDTHVLARVVEVAEKNT
jgi:hypothetical protein